MRSSLVRVLTTFGLITSCAVSLATSDEPHKLREISLTCRDCYVGAGVRASLARLIRHNDLVFEGTSDSSTAVTTRWEKGRVLVHFRVERVLRGLTPTRDAVIMMLTREQIPAPGTQVLAWVLPGCSIDGHPCGDYVRITPERKLIYSAVNAFDWKRDAILLSCDSLESDIGRLPDSTGLEAFRHVAALAVVQLEIRDPVNSARFPGHGYPTNGGEWPLEGLRWLLGRENGPPHWVTFPRVPWAVNAEEASYRDRFLLPLAGNEGETLTVSANWRPMLVRNGEAVGFGVPVDSVASLFERDSTGYHLRATGTR